jgi:hypothetical protein
MPKVKSKRSAGQDVVLGEDLLLEFDDEGVAECPEHRASDLARERKFRPGVFHLVETKKEPKPAEPKKGVSPKLAEKVAKAEDKSAEEKPEKVEPPKTKKEEAPEKALAPKKSATKSSKKPKKASDKDSSEGEKE